MIEPEYEIYWNGSMKDTHLCIQPPPLAAPFEPMEFPDEPRKKNRPYMDRGTMRRDILEILAGRGPMPVRELKYQLGTKDAQFYNLLTQMVMHGLILRPEKGFVQGTR